MQRLRREFDRDAPKIDYAAQAFNQAALTYNRAAREAPTHVVARLFRFAEATVVSPNLGKPSPRGPKAKAPVAPTPSDHPAAVPVAATVPEDTTAKPPRSDSENATSQ